MINLKHFVTFAVVSLLVLPRGSFAVMRVWEQTDGVSFEAEYQRSGLGKFYFRDSKNRTISVAETNLVARDVKYIYSTIPPKIEVDLSVKKTQKERNEDVTTDDAITIVTATAIVSKAAQTPFYGTLRAELYLIGDEVATDEHFLLAKQAFPIRFPEGRKPAVEFSLVTEVREYLEYDRATLRGREYAGYMLLVYAPNGELIQKKNNLSWLKDENAETLRKLPVRSFFDDECRQRSTPRLPVFDRRLL